MKPSTPITLKKNDPIIIVSPAGRVLNENIDNAVEVLEKWGLKVIVSPNAKKEYFNYSGTKEERLTDLQWALDHPEAKAIFAARGGYGTIQLLDKLEWSEFEKKPKLLVGYSDICNLHAVINNMGIASLHGLMPNSFPHNGESNLSLETLKQALFLPKYKIDWETTLPISDITLEGEVVGGNLSILYSLQGTPFAPDYLDKILFIEDLDEYVYHIDRILNSMELSGAIHKLKGIIVGDFTGIKENKMPFGKSIEQIIYEMGQRLGIPVVFGLHTGHDEPTIALPLGRKGQLQVKDQHCTLSFE